jgi:eukaryotic-like serine/threonine-protein kinase
MLEVIDGRFEIEREAGSGGMARVYRARDLTNGSPVAVKVISGTADRDVRRFQREVAALSSLRHHAIVRYVHHGVANAKPYLAMEWLEGEDLEQRLERGPIDPIDALALTTTIAEALGEAHARGIVHRDIKPSNIFLEGGALDRPKVLDFGIARDLTATAGLTVAGNIIGTPTFMAPEQARGEPDLDPRVDVHALGALLYTCIAGRPPFVASNVIALLAKIVLEPPPRLEVSGALDRLLDRLLAKSPSDRPSDGRAVAAELAELSLVDSQPRRGTVSLTSEQRVVCVLLAQGLEGTAVGTERTIDIAGGSAQRLADGSSVVTFTGPESPSDLAARAVVFALAVRSPTMALSLATGRAVISGAMPVGEAIERAASGLSNAHGKLVVDETTAGLVEGRFAVEEGVVLRAHDELDVVRTLLGKPTRCVGRDREIAALDGYFNECVEESLARVIVVTAPAGTGKSRLTREVIGRWSDRAEILFSRAESVGAGSPFAVLATALRREDFGRDEFLCELLGDRTKEPSDALRAARETPSLMFEGIRRGWELFLERRLGARPVVLVIEDLHWGDAPSVSLIESSLRMFRERPLLVVAAARPEVRDRFPTLFVENSAHELRLDPLAKRASERLVRDALGAAATDDIVRQILERAEGNAFFLEELVRAAAHGDVQELPTGVIGVVQLRFDGLTQGARTVLGVASVFGERFTRCAVEALVPATIDVRAAISELIARELVAGPGEPFTFRHALVRDAAYALLTDADRTTAHALAGEHLAAEGGQAPIVVAEHFDRGGVRGRAAAWYLRAAEQALDGNDLDSAIEHARRGIERTEDAALLGELELVIADAELWRGRLPAARDAAMRAIERLEKGTAAWFHGMGLAVTTRGQLGDNEGVIALLEAAMVSDPRADALSQFVLCLTRACSQLVWAGHGDSARRALAHVDAAVAGRKLSANAEGRLLFARAYDAFDRGINDQCIGWLMQASEAQERALAKRDALQSRLLAAMILGFSGMLSESIQRLAACEREALALAAPYLASWARFEIALMTLLRGDREGGLSILDSVPDATKNTPLFRSGFAVVAGYTAIELGDCAGARAAIERVDTEVPRYRAALDAILARVVLAEGDREAARTIADAAVATLASVRGLKTEVFIAGYAALIDVYEVLEPRRARAIAERLASTLQETSAQFRDRALAESFLTNIPWNRQILAAAARHRGQ